MNILYSLALLLVAGLAQAAGVGDTLPALSLNDQFDRPHTLTTDVKRVYYTRDMAGSKLMKAVLEQNGQQRLDAQQAVALSDLSGMPGPIRNMMALPGLKKRSYAIWLDLEGSTATLLPNEADSVAVIDLQALRITGVQFIKDEAGLRALLP